MSASIEVAGAPLILPITDEKTNMPVAVPKRTMKAAGISRRLATNTQPIDKVIT